MNDEYWQDPNIVEAWLDGYVGALAEVQVFADDGGDPLDFVGRILPGVMGDLEAARERAAQYAMQHRAHLHAARLAASDADIDRQIADQLVARHERALGQVGEELRKLRSLADALRSHHDRECWCYPCAVLARLDGEGRRCECGSPLDAAGKCELGKRYDLYRSDVEGGHDV